MTGWVGFGVVPGWVGFGGYAGLFDFGDEACWLGFGVVAGWVGFGVECEWIGFGAVGMEFSGIVAFDWFGFWLVRSHAGSSVGLFVVSFHCQQ